VLVRYAYRADEVPLLRSMVSRPHETVTEQKQFVREGSTALLPSGFTPSSPPERGTTSSASVVDRVCLAVPRNLSMAKRTRSKKQRVMQDVAFYYPGPMWQSPDRLKTLLLFFDGVALLLPRYMKDRPEKSDPIMATPLRQAGLLHLLEPEVLVDKTATQQLAAAVGELVRSGRFDSLGKDGTAFHELSYSRLGGYGDPELADALLKELKAKKLARDTEDGVSIPMHPIVRSAILVLLAQILRQKGDELGMELSPTTDRPQLVDALCEVLSLSQPASTGGVVAFDLETVAPDLSLVPIDEVLDFRRQHLKDYKAYARDVRRFVREIGALPARQRVKAFRDRQEEIRELAADLKKTGWKAWKKPASFGLSIAGAAWTLKTGDPIGALLAAASAAAGLGGDSDTQVNAYSYLFAARSRYG